jgi:hypothetical protein
MRTQRFRMKHGPTVAALRRKTVKSLDKGIAAGQPLVTGEK